MDDDLVLNIAADSYDTSGAVSGKKGGRWTQRVKAKRVAKRKTRPEVPEGRPLKKPRKEVNQPTVNFAPVVAPVTATVSQPRPVQNVSSSKASTQIISSLFTYNPKVETVARSTLPKTHALPSNAPLADASSFSGLGLDPLITAHLASKLAISRPTSIQRASLPALLSTSKDTAARDVFIQSQTGSGKTLSFLLPIIQDLLPLSKLSYIDRSIGTLAIIIAPTRELAKQISDVLEALLQLRLRPESEDAEGASSTRLTRWLVSGLLTGGATRTHEKARLRKGVPILVSTPGRLLDHLQNTSSFNVGKCRWLVLDEADRLMELGFEETITGIMQGLDGRRKLALQAVQEGNSMEVGGWDWERKRRTVLCSATIREDVQKLAGTTLVQPLMVKATEVEEPMLGALLPVPVATPAPAEPPISNPNAEKFTPPSQLSQKYVVVPLKLRLVALVALLRTLVAESQGRKGTKIIVFLSCTDSVDFHWNLLGGTAMDSSEDASAETPNHDDENEDSDAEKPESTFVPEKVEMTSSLLPDTAIFRLHGSLATPVRMASLKGFSGGKSKHRPATTASSSILLCTSVASRGLDLPLVRAVVQYDLPTEGGATEYVHRVGRTARVGKGGEAWSIVAPSESEWVKWVEGKMRGEEKDQVAGDENRNVTLTGVDVDQVLKSGFGGRGSDHEARATEVQLAFERWVLRKRENAGMARKAFLSNMRAYATHPSNEKHMFHIRHLHLGHLAKAFALRDAPKAVTGASVNYTSTKRDFTKPRRDVNGKERVKVPKVKVVTEQSNDAEDDGDSDDAPKRPSKPKAEWTADHSGDAEKRMQEIVRTQGRLTKKGGVMMSSGTSEFQIAGGYGLEKLVMGRGKRT